MEVCKICGKSFNRLSTHLTRAHNMTLDEYRELYDDSTSYGEVVVSGNEDSDVSPNSTITPSDQTNEAITSIINSTATSQQEKEAILSLIRNKYPDTEKDYPVDLKSKGVLIVDFASPSQKIVFNFPNTFWHNQSLYFNEKVLNDNQWKVVNYYNLQDFLEEIDK